MTYWSVSLLGGPQALAALARIEDSLQLARGQLYPLDRIPEDARARLAQRLDADFQPLHAALRAAPRAEEPVALQVAAAVVMAVGAKIPQAFRHRALAAIRRDPTARRCAERRLEMEAFHRRLACYQAGRPDPVGEEPLTVATGRRRLAKMAQPLDGNPAASAPVRANA